ncbi:MAG: hypothetical protein WC765_09080, partial [Phycisphaerae bacterium]
MSKIATSIRNLLFLAAIAAAIAFITVKYQDYAKPPSGQAALLLAKSGKTDYSIYVDAKATAAEKFAAQTLAEYCKRITGVDFPIVNSADRNM